MKRSKVVALVAIGMGPFALAACDRRPECKQGEPQAQECRPTSSAHGGGGRAAGYGPAVLQAFQPLPSFDGLRPVIGSWIVGDRPCGMGIREDATAITGNRSRFVPHAIM